MSAPDRVVPQDRVHGRVAEHPTHGRPFSAGLPSEALFGPSVTNLRPVPPVRADRDYRAIRDTPEFAELRRRTLLFAVPATVAFMGNYLLFVLLSAYEPQFMATPVFGLVNAGILIGMLQFVTTMVIVGLYCRYARNRMDPLVDVLHAGADRR